MIVSWIHKGLKDFFLKRILWLAFGPRTLDVGQSACKLLIKQKSYKTSICRLIACINLRVIVQGYGRLA